MRILQVIYNLSSGGAERLVVDLCNIFAENKSDEIHLLTTDDDAITGNKHYYDSLSKNVVYHNIGAKSGFSFKSIIGVYRMIKNIKPDIVHLHSNLILLFLPALLYNKAKYIHTLHNLAEKTLTVSQLKFICSYLYKNKVQPIAISDVCQKSYSDFYKQDNAICVTNGRAKLSITEEYKSVKNDIAKYKNGREVPVFIHVARYAEQKNQKLLFDTFTQLRNIGKEFLLLVIGAGYEKSPYMHLNDTDYIKILGAKQNVGDYLACADFFVLSSTWEGLPLSLLEAMSMGCIPISTPAGGVVDVIRDGKNGLLSPSFNPEDYYNTVLSVFDKDFSINKEEILEDYENNYTMEVCANKYYSVYTKLIR